MRFEASVEDMLIGKYGIAWCSKYKKYKEAYYTTNFTKWVFNNVHPVPYGKLINIVLLLGILEYEQNKRWKICNESTDNTACLLYRDCHDCHLGRDNLKQAIKLVRAEIQKIQGGVG